MTTAHGHNGVATVGPQKPQRWVLLLALVAITAIGVTAVALILSNAGTEVSTAPAVVAPVEVAPAPAEAPVAPAIVAPVLESPLSMQELALMSEAATGLVPTRVLEQEMALGIEKAYEATALGVRELALMSEFATGLVPTGILADEMAIGHEKAYAATALGGHEYALMSEFATGLVPTGILEDEMAIGHSVGFVESTLSAEEFALMSEAATGLVPTGVLENEMAAASGFDYSATIGNTSMSNIVNALIGVEAGTSYISLEEYEFISEVLRGLVPTGVLEDEMAAASGFDYSATIGNTSMSNIVNALIGTETLTSAISAEEYALMSEALKGLVPTGVLEDEGVTP